MANLKKLFPEFYQEPFDQNDLRSESENIIVFDTNYLLEIIKAPSIVSKEYVEAMEKVKENIYIPYLVALEFNFNKSKRKKSKNQQIHNYKKEVIDNIYEVKTKINDVSFVNEDNKSSFTNELIILTENFAEKMKKLIDDKVEVMVTNEQEELYNKLIEIIEDKIGEQYSESWVSEVEKDGESRFNNNIPPGYDDAKKGKTNDDIKRTYGDFSYQRKYGDLLIWKDIIDFSKKSKEDGRKGKKVIFVTDDGQSTKKNDLLYKVNNLTVGPHIYLMNELRREANKEFYILNNLRFIQIVNELSDDQVEKLKINIDNEKDFKNRSTSYLDLLKKYNSILLDPDTPKEIIDQVKYDIKNELSIENNLGEKCSRIDNQSIYKDFNNRETLLSYLNRKLKSIISNPNISNELVDQVLYTLKNESLSEDELVEICNRIDNQISKERLKKRLEKRNLDYKYDGNEKLFLTSNEMEDYYSTNDEYFRYKPDSFYRRDKNPDENNV